VEGARFDDLDVVRLRGTVDRAWWTSGLGGSPNFFLCLNRDGIPMSLSQLNRDARLDAGAAALGSCTEGGEIWWRGCNDLSLIVVPQARLRELVAGADDLVARPLQRCDGSLGLLRRYLDILLALDGTEDQPELVAHIARTVTDLVALALCAQRERAETARMRGLRAARLQQIIAEIGIGFADPAFSVQHLARKLGLRARYVQALLQETGSTFTERLVELRLQRARAMLAAPHHDRLKIGEIAAACGFNEIPHFNHCFRRRFGTTPTQHRRG
jgi:AraC-like DNA-binding protein